MLPLSARLRHLSQRIAPAVLLAATLGLAAVLHFEDGGMSGATQGFAELDTHDVAASERGVIFALDTDVGQDVLAGDVIARLDTSTLDSQIEVVRAERAALEEAVTAERERKKIETDDNVGDLKRRLAEAEEERLRIAAEAAVIDRARERLERLVESKQATKDELLELEAKQAALAPLKAWQPQSIGVIAEQIEKTKKRRNDGAVTQDLEAQVRFAEARIHELLVRREATIIRAPRSGRVVEVFKRRGDFADIGFPLVRIASHTNRVVACVRDGSGVDAEEGTLARVRAKGATGAAQPASVIAASPVVAELPPQCQPDPQRPIFGRRLLLTVDGPSTFLSGQAVEIDFKRGKGAGKGNHPHPPAEAQPGSLDAELTFTKLGLPSSLADRSRFEPSGLARAPGGDDLFVLSDDTGLDGERIPIVFRMSQAGVVDATPVTLTNLEEVTDLESIATVGDKFFLLSSQSRSKNDKRPAARTLFLEATPTGDHTLDVVAQTKLWKALGDLGDLSKLGLARGAEVDLDIEGMTAMPDGSLLLGLKSPLTDAGEAMVWRLRDPSKFARGASLADAGLEPWGKVSLPLSHDGEPLHGGISELVLRKDGSLVLTATPARSDRTTGAAFIVSAEDAQRGGLLRARTLVHFPNRKPEGLVELASGDVMVAFDNGSAPGEITTLPAASLR